MTDSSDEQGQNKNRNARMKNNDVAIGKSTSQDQVMVTLSPAESSAGPGETVTFDMNVENTDGTIGAHNSAVSVTDTAVAEITDVELLGDPGYQDLDLTTDGRTADLAAALMETQNSDTITIGQVEVEVLGPGTTNLEVDVTTLSDAVGNTYTVDRTEGASLSVSSDGLSITVDDATMNVGGQATISISASNSSAITVRDLWSDWKIIETQPDGGTTRNNVPEAGVYEIEWNQVRQDVAPTLTVSVPERYVGGTYAVEVVTTDGVNTERDVMTLDITD